MFITSIKTQSIQKQKIMNKFAIYYLFVFIFIFWGCVNKPKKKQVFEIGNITENKKECNCDTIFPFNYRIKNKLEKDTINLLSNLFSVSKENITLLKIKDSICIKNLGFINIFKGNIFSTENKKLPTVSIGSFYLFSKSSDNFIQFMSFDSIFFIKETETDTEFLIGGFPNNRSAHTFFFILNYKHSCFYEIFSTEEYIYKYNTDCSDYNNDGYLYIKNIDVNNDGLLDLQFTGIEYRYCDGLETGKNRNNSSVISQKNISYIYFQKRTNNVSSWKKNE